MSYSSPSLASRPDDRFYSPNAKPQPPRVPQPGEPLWSLRANGVTWEAQLRYHGEYGVEAQILRQGEVVIGRRFDTRMLAVQWAEEERQALDREDSAKPGR